MSGVVRPGLTVKATITIRIWEDEAMTIEGPLQDPRWVLLALEQARDAVRRQISDAQLGITIPGKDVAL